MKYVVVSGKNSLELERVVRRYANEYKYQPQGGVAVAVVYDTPRLFQAMVKYEAGDEYHEEE